MVKLLRFCIQGAGAEGYKGHPQEVLQGLGIEYSYAVPQSISDSWHFWNPHPLPEKLPPFLRVSEEDPKSFIGYGLDESLAQEIENAAEALESVYVYKKTGDRFFLSMDKVKNTSNGAGWGAMVFFFHLETKEPFVMVAEEFYENFEKLKGGKGES